MVISSSNPFSGFYPLGVKSEALSLAFQAGHDLAPFISLPPISQHCPYRCFPLARSESSQGQNSGGRPRSPPAKHGADLRHHFQLSTPAITLMLDFHLPDSHIYLSLGPELGRGGRSYTLTSTPQRMRATEPPLSPLYSDPGSLTSQRWPIQPQVHLSPS